MFLQPMTSSASADGAGRHEGNKGPASEDFWRRPFVQNMLPFLTSLSVHAGVLIIGLLTFKAIQVISRPALQVQPVAMTAELASNGPPAFPGMTDKPLLPVQQDQSPNDTNLTGISAFARGAKIEVNGGPPSDAGANVISIGPGNHFGKGGGTGGSAGPGTGDEGMRARFGVPQITGVQNVVFGHLNGARRVTYVCDCSGSMINKLSALKGELTKAVSVLRPNQSFSMVFFNDKSKPDSLNADLIAATPQNKRRAGEFLEGATAAGTTNPIPGIEAAFHQKPELIYLLTDGDFEDNAAVLARIRELNKDKRVRVNTIAFVGTGDTDIAFIDLLKTIANENGGTYRHVKENELGN